MDRNNTEEMLQAVFDRIITGIFLVSISLPLLIMVVPGLRTAAPVEEEQRAAVPFPKLGWKVDLVRAFPEQFDAYVNDAFGLRQALIDWNSWLYYRALRMSTSPKVVVGRGKWLFFNGDAVSGDLSPIVDYSGRDPLAPHELENLRWMYQDQHDWLQEHGMKYLFVVIPSKPALYADQLPRRYRGTGRPCWREQLVPYLKAKTDVPVLDLTAALAAEEAESRMFMHTDSHWSEFGAFVGHREIIKALQPWFPALKPHDEADYRKEPVTTKGGDLARMLALSEELREDRMKLQPDFPTQATRTQLGDYRLANIVGGTGDERLPTAYVYRDSFANSLIPFLTEYFNKIEYEWGQTGTKMVGIEEKKPDVVLQIMVDRILKTPLSTAPRIRKDRSVQRFERATDVVAAYSPENAFAGMTSTLALNHTLVAGGVAIEIPQGGSRFLLPAIDDMDTRLPVVRIDVRPPGNSILQISGTTPARRPWHAPIDIPLARSVIEPGRNVVYETITDTRPMQALAIDLGPRPGTYVLYGIEVRSIPR